MSDPSFCDFYRAVNGHEPFPWQVRAAQRLAQRQTFAVSVPTGLGKSSMVDAAVWAAAHGAWRRIAFVVDRRIVVDAVHQRALRIAGQLSESLDPGVRALAARIGQMQVVRLRGGVYGDDDWVLYPERLTVVLTTVDQLGSRLMFRGYGVSLRRWPLHAGFLGSDTLVVVDEAHLSQPFLQTLRALHDGGANVATVPMSGTLASTSDVDVVALQDDDLALPVVQQRLRACKSVRLVESRPGEADFVRCCVEQAAQFAREPGVGCIALIVNRVASARSCFELLKAQGLDAELLTGRVRPVDRDARLAGLLPRVEAGRIRQESAAPLVVVATQTIEVGADFDFDAVVTECATTTALRQRFGRLDRLGERGQSSGTIVYRPSKGRDDPVYGPVLADTWDWLLARSHESGDALDFGLAALEDLTKSHSPPSEPIRHAASLLPTHLQLIAQTGPFAPAFDLGAWLHGPSDRAPDVTLIWRDDLHQASPNDWAHAVGLLPPMSREGLSMPVAAVRRWLTGGKLGDQWSDTGSAADDDTTGADEERPVLRWRGPEDCHLIPARTIRPGDTLVLPTTYGGCDAWGWAPTSSAPVPDTADECLAERVAARAACRVTLRLTEGHWAAFGDASTALRAKVQALSELEARTEFAEEGFEDELNSARDALLVAVKASHHPLVALMRDERIERHPLGYVIRGSGIEEVEGVLETGRPVPLDVHHEDVGRWARLLSVDDAHAEEIAAAALVHDAGKADERMQALLHGSAIAAAAGPTLAKSKPLRRDEQLAAWRASGIPKGFRHEFASLEVVELRDPLIRHLVATHHGFGRPWQTACADPNALGARYASLDSHWADAWAGNVLAHGPWALARMEWLLRAADIRASIEEAKPGQEVSHGR